MPTTPHTPDRVSNTFHLNASSPEIALSYQRYVQARGGGYFFAPSIGVLAALADGIPVPDWACEPPSPLEESRG